MHVLRDKIHPLILPYYETVQFDDEKRVAILSFPQGISKPYVVRDKGEEKIYIRIGSTSQLATREQQMRLFEIGGMLHTELLPVPRTDIACLDLEEIMFPLTIRHWQHGDYFFPLGMDQMKKLSDFFVDNKIAVPEKQQTWIMASGKKIVWIMGHRIDHRFRITDQTTRILKLAFQTNVLP